MKNIKNYIFVLVYMLLIFYLSSIPLQMPEIIERIDPTRLFLHAIEYSLLGFLLFNARRNVLFSVSIGSAYGMSDEIHQFFVPSRHFSVFDITADIIGTCLGVLFFQLCMKFKWFGMYNEKHH